MWHGEEQDATAHQWRDPTARLPQLSGVVRAGAVVGGALRDLPCLLAALRRGAPAGCPPRPGPAARALPGVRPPHAPPRPGARALSRLRRGPPLPPRALAPRLSFVTRPTAP